jgi:sugar phosphate isomerase/epimerase
MRLGCAAYSYRDPLKAGAMTLEQFVDTCAGMELDGVELTSYYFPSTDTAYLQSLKRHCFLRGMHILGTAVGSNFTQPDEDKRREHLRMTLDWIDHSVTLGAPCIRVFAGPIPAEVPEEQAFTWARDCLAECVEHAAQRGVVVALENHGGVTATADQVSRFLKELESPWFGINLDFGNFSRDPYAEIGQVSPWAVTTHAKLVSKFGEERRELDYPRVRKIMERAGYRGYISVEYEEKEDPAAAVPRFVDQLRQAFA